MGKKQNAFGGGNPHSLYVPMSEDEQEVLHRLVESQTMRIVVHLENYVLVVVPFWVGVGDKRVAIRFEIPVPENFPTTAVRSLDLDLQAMEGISLIRKPYPTLLPDGTPLVIEGGSSVGLQWDIAIDHIDPALVKKLKPAAWGLTTRRLDPVTGARTLEGNMRYGQEKRDLLRFVEAGERRVQRDSLMDLKKAEET